MADTVSAAPACSLEARDFKQRVAWIAALNDRSLQNHRREDAVLTLTYAPEALAEVEEMLAREQECCAFLGFKLRKTSDVVQVTITVPPGHRANAEILLAPFYDNRAEDDTSSCCGACQHENNE